MSEVILHQYAASPFSEKIRKILAHKKVSWRSANQPALMPKPKLTPLTGGYRRIPVMQLGADVYCDTGVIVRKLEELFPEPTLYPGQSEGICHMMSLWADRRLFLSAIPAVFVALGSNVPKEFVEDRSKMTRGRPPGALGGGVSFDEMGDAAPDARNQTRALLAMLERQLSDRPFLLGNAFSLADAACFHPVWFMRVAPDSFALVQRSPNLMRWFERIDALGQGQVQPIEPDEALKIARESQPATKATEDRDDPNGLKPGMRVGICPDDYGFDVVAGTIVALSTYEIAIEREEPTLGRIVNHFPRVGFSIRLM